MVSILFPVFHTSTIFVMPWKYFVTMRYSAHTGREDGKWNRAGWKIWVELVRNKKGFGGKCFLPGTIFIEG
jgi:hypothetical protein